MIEYIQDGLKVPNLREVWGSGKILLHEIILLVGLLQVIKSDNGTPSLLRSPKGLQNIAHYLLTLFIVLGGFKSSRKVERANKFLKLVIKE